MQAPSDTPAKLVRKRLDASGVEAHVRQLVATASQIEVRIKQAGASSAPTDGVEAAVRSLLAGEVTAIQLRSCAGETWWIDTLMRARDGYRLVRMREGS